MPLLLQRDIRMTTYNSYEEAKIANPESQIVTTGPNWEYNPALKWKFEKLVEDDGEVDAHALEDSAWVKCNPADYCMTVEKFLKDGHKFVYGDLFLDQGGCVEKVSNVDNYNIPFIGDNKRYILRAAASEKPKRVKVEYVKVSKVTSIFTLSDDYSNGILFDHEEKPVKSEIHLMELLTSNLLKRMVQTEVTERDEFINECIVHGGLRARDGAREVYGNLFDSGKFKLVD